MTEVEVEILKSQLAVARNEINKLRQQVKSLTHIQRKDVENIKDLIQNYRCEGCRQKEENSKNQNDCVISSTDVTDKECIKFRPIGIIRTSFPEKRAVPRQSSIASCLKGSIEITSEIFTNPEHSLDGLSEFSHLWIIYHFHKNTAHPKAKVAPPRLGGERVGVFSTRSPHRPCPIGLSLVEIDRIEDSVIYFNGTDMVDGTPVLDVKPYIPFYDAPQILETGRLSVGENFDFYNTRQEPDGEESELDGAVGLPTQTTSQNYLRNSRAQKDNFNLNTIGLSSGLKMANVKIPNWIVAGQTLNVHFNDRAEKQLDELQVDKQSIVEILEGDPRSVYLRTKHGSQIFTFQLSEVTVTCKFDDKNSSVTVVQVRKTENLQNTDSNDRMYP